MSEEIVVFYVIRRDAVYFLDYALQAGYIAQYYTR